MNTSKGTLADMMSDDYFDLPDEVEGVVTLDDASCKAKKPSGDEVVTLDAAAKYAADNIAVMATNALYVWAEIDDDELSEDEGFGDRLMAMLVGIADPGKDGELSEDEQEVINTAKGVIAIKLEKEGVDSDDIEKLLGDWDNKCGERVHDLMLSKLPDGEEAVMDDINAFVFDSDIELDDDAQVALDDISGDGVTFDAAYKKVIAFRNGKKTIKKKRISGRVKLSAKQKLSIKKMQRKSHKAGANMKRMKSMRKRRAAGY